MGRSKMNNIGVLTLYLSTCLFFNIAMAGKGKKCKVCEDLAAKFKLLNDKVDLLLNTSGKDGGWGSWSNWTACTATCDTGIKFRQRKCDNPKPSKGGIYCDGSSLDVSLCNERSCSDTDGGWNSWSGWTDCNQTCNTGLKYRQRLCDNPKPSKGAAYCSGSPFDVSLCNQQLCPNKPNTSFRKGYGTSFVTGFMKNLEPGEPTLLVACPEGSAIVNVSIPVLNIINATYMLSGNMLNLPLPKGIISQTSGQVARNGVYVTTNRPVKLFSANFYYASSDGSLVPPETSLGTDYIISGHQSSLHGTDEFLIVGTFDRTIITINVNSVVKTVTLNRMETYMQAAAYLSGTRITATAPVYVLSGHSCANIPNHDVLYCDYIDEAMPPTSSLGTVHIVSFMKPRPDFTISIVSVRNDTSITIYDASGNTLENVNLKLMATTVFRSYTAFKAISLVSNQPVLVTQYGHGSNRAGGDPSMMVIPDVSHFGQEYDFVVPKDFNTPSTITIVMAETYTSSGLLLNGQAFIPTQTIAVTVPGKGKYYVLYGNVSAGYNRLTHAAEAAVTFGAWLYGFTIYTEYAWSLVHT